MSGSKGIWLRKLCSGVKGAAELYWIMICVAEYTGA